jgi:hypothetical protein
MLDGLMSRCTIGKVARWAKALNSPQCTRSCVSTGNTLPNLEFERSIRPNLRAQHAGHSPVMRCADPRRACPGARVYYPMLHALQVDWLQPLSHLVTVRIAA